MSREEDSRGQQRQSSAEQREAERGRVAVRWSGGVYLHHEPAQVFTLSAQLLGRIYLRHVPAGQPEMKQLGREPALQEMESLLHVKHVHVEGGA
jgi:hypothetical protein